MPADDPSTPDLLERFAAAMGRLEANGDVDALVALYDEASVTGHVREPESFEGIEGARAFWTRYREQFEAVSSTYRLMAGDAGGGVLEWDTEATMAGRPVRYRGATVIETADGRITRSCAYFDPTSLGEQVISDA